MDGIEISLVGAVWMKDEQWSYARYKGALLEEQLGAINGLYDPQRIWEIPDALQKKVDLDGSLLPFFGDTTVFELSSQQVAEVGELIALLEPISENLATPLDRQQLHMTLHDLNNSSSPEEIATPIAKSKHQVIIIMKLLKEYLKDNPDHRYINMVSTRAYPSSNIAVLLGLIPKSELDFQLLIKLYNIFDSAVYLDYWLRPHITLAYFKPRELRQVEIAGLRSCLDQINQREVEIKLDILELAYQHFDHMNQYQTKFCPRTLTE